MGKTCSAIIKFYSERKRNIGDGVGLNERVRRKWDVEIIIQIFLLLRVVERGTSKAMTDEWVSRETHTDRSRERER